MTDQEWEEAEQRFERQRAADASDVHPECVHCGGTLGWDAKRLVHLEHGSADCYADDWQGRKATPE